MHNPYRYTGEYADDAGGLQYNRARWYDAAAGRFISVDPAAGFSGEPLSLNKYLYANADPVNKTDPSGWTTTHELNAGSSVQSDLQTTTARDMIRGAFKKFGCELGSALAEETVTHGIYILMDSLSGRLYVGQATHIDDRFKRHLAEAKKKVQFEWKKTSKIIMRFNIPGSDTALSKAEQLVMHILEKEGQILLNGREQIGPDAKDNLLEKYKRFKKIICPKL